jgi:hypothetical protein
MAASPPSEFLKSVMMDIRANPRVNETMLMMEERTSDFGSGMTAGLAGIAMQPEARMYLESRLDEHWSGDIMRLDSELFQPVQPPEVVIGAGLHAAVYCAARARMGRPRPVVIEAGRVGGAFAVGGGKPAFYLNSRNRPGTPGVPREGQLNFLPGAPVQAAHIAAGEYPSNADMAFCVRTALAAYADVYRGQVVSYGNGYGMNVFLEEGGSIPASRIIDTRGMGTDSAVLLPDSRVHVLTFQEFMSRMTEPFPLRGMRRVAVIGNGDSARCAVESLLGIAPVSHFSSPLLDWVQGIDWYGRSLFTNREDWEVSEPRSRYIEIERYLPRSEVVRNSPSRRLRVLQQTAPVPLDSPDGASVGPRSYDLVIMCAGVTRRVKMQGIPEPDQPGWENYVPRNASDPVARRYQQREIYAAGPITALPYSTAETNANAAEIPSSTVSIWRNAPKTAALAMSLA